ncbi:carboxypeptidase-like regulatory domain-containing protein [Haladaptatus sp. CMAA 1911]|uniref:carboxypeptidase-like regulatory domain-containing protein n=1 Tax=unclassified Haladaptatus TaxID=2622732 RepID=UPI003754E273
MSRFTASLGLLALLLVATVLPAQVAAISAADSTQLTSTPDQVETVPLARNNSSVHHEDPDNVRSEEDLSGLESYLAGQLSSRLGGSSVQIEQGQYQKARSVLGDDYNDLLSKYVEVSGQTEGTKDDQTAETLKNTQENQKKYVSRVQRYRTLHDRYQRAKQNGNDNKARNLARKLNRLARQINQKSDNLTSNYDQLSNRTNVSTDQEKQRIQNVTQNISTQQTEVRETEFVKTDLSVSLESDQVSFLEPITITGQLTDENGTAIENKSIYLLMGGNRTKRTDYRTDEDGEFTLTGRPAVTALGSQSFRVEYRPRNDTIYLGSNETVQATVSQVEGNISISSHTQRLRYNDTMSVSGRVQAEDIVAVDVPVAIYAGNVRLGTTRTAQNGTFSFTRSLPANVPSDVSKIRVVFPFRNRSLTAANTTAPVTIDPSQTTLTLSGSEGKPRNVDFSGQLKTKSGESIAGQQVQIFTNGTQVASTRTNKNGSYRVSTVLPAALLSSTGNTTFVARFNGRGKNVESARASTTLLSSVAENDSLLPIPRRWLGLGIAGVGVFVALGGYFFVRSNDDESEEMAESNESTPEPDSAPTPEEPESDSSPSAMAFLDRARSARDEGEFERAVEMGYAATRDRFANLVPTTSLTHWEFYNACQEADVGDETLSTIGEVTERYERAAFATNRVSRETATAVIEAVSSLVDDDSDSVTE